MSGLETKVDKSFCDERFERIQAHIEASIAPLSKEVKIVNSHQLEVLKAIQTLTKQLKRNGNPTSTNSSRAGKYIFYGTVVTAMGLLAKEVIVFISTLV